jgi:hypothetical protein
MLFSRLPAHKYLLVSESNERLTFEAADDQVAFRCGLWLGNTIAICYRIEKQGLLPIVSYFERPYSPRDYAWQHHKVDPVWFAQMHIIELDDALQSVVFQRPLGGQMLTRYLNMSEQVKKLRSDAVGR